MPETWIVPELEHNFIDSFSKMMIDYIYDNWSITTGNAANQQHLQVKQII